MGKKDKDSIVLRAIPLDSSGKSMLSFIYYYEAAINLIGNEREVRADEKNHNKCLGNVVLDGIQALQESGSPKKLDVIMEGEFSTEDKKRIRTAFDMYASSSKARVSYRSRSVGPYLEEQERLAKERSDEEEAQRFCNRFL